MFDNNNLNMKDNILSLNQRKKKLLRSLWTAPYTVINILNLF